MMEDNHNPISLTCVRGILTYLQMLTFLYFCPGTQKNNSGWWWSQESPCFLPYHYSLTHKTSRTISSLFLYIYRCCCEFISLLEIKLSQKFSFYSIFVSLRFSRFTTSRVRCFLASSKLIVSIYLLNWQIKYRSL